MNIALWVVQILLAAAFFATGAGKVFRFEQAKQRMPILAGKPRSLANFIGASEMLEAVGLVLPVLTGILPWLTPLAAVGLGTIMVLATGVNATRREYPRVAANLVLLALAAWVAYGRWVLLAA